MLWETVKRNDLIQRESYRLNLDKMELLEHPDLDASAAKGGGFGALSQVIPGIEGAKN